MKYTGINKLPQNNYKHFKRPFVFKYGVLVRPRYQDLIDQIQPLIKDGENTQILLTTSLLSGLGFIFEYDKFKKTTCAKNYFMNLWWDPKENAYYILTCCSKFYVRLFYDFQTWYCYQFCIKFKSYYDFDYLDWLIGLDRRDFKNVIDTVIN
jgi:hypothetical protein